MSRVIKLFFLFGVLALGIGIMFAMNPSVEVYTSFVDNNIREHGFLGVTIYILLVTVLSCVSVPRQLLSLIGGYAFGALGGTFLATIGVTFGCMISFGYARLFGQNFVRHHFGPRIQKAEDFLVRAPFSMTFLVRCLPVGNNLLTNLLAGLTRIPALPFFAGSALGYIAQNFIFALLGSGARVDPIWRTLLSAALFLLASAIGLYLYKKHREPVDEAFLEQEEQEEAKPENDALSENTLQMFQNR